MSEKTTVAPGTETCGCCTGVAASTPMAVYNRAGLTAIGYRIGDYGRFRASLHAGLSSGAYPQLAGLRTRDPDDYTLGLLDAVACAADVLTFYQELLANESYLRTATERVSLQEMGKLIAYRLRPGVAAETWLAFALETPRSAPANLVPEPGAFVTGIPERLTLPAGLKVQSVPGPGEKPQTFETIEEIAARPEWSAMRPWLAGAPAVSATDTWIKGLAVNLKVGDLLVFADPDFFAHPASSIRWDVALVDAVEPGDTHTRVSWRLVPDRPSAIVGSAALPQVYALRRRAAVFGHNAPMWASVTRQFRHAYPAGKVAPNWPGFTISETTDSVDLDAVYGEVKRDGLAVLMHTGVYLNRLIKGSFSKGGVYGELTPATSTGLYKIIRTSELSRAAFALSGKVTRIGLEGQNLTRDFFEHVRETSVYVQSELLELAPYPVTDAVVGALLPVAVSPDGLFAGRKLIVTGLCADDSRLVHQATLVVAKPDQHGALLTITPPLPASLQRDTVVVYANVAHATHGETVAQILGAGDASSRFQRFELKRLPLTYRSSASEGGAKVELSVRVGEVAWTGKPTLYSAAPAERAYTVSVDEQGRHWVVFGDGVHGARLPGGVNNVRAQYRQGLGREGNVGSDQLTQLMSRPLGLKSVSNPLAAQGGADSEPAGQARRTMPLGTRTLGRVVSLLDYQDFALAFSGIAKAQAQVLRLPGGPALAITVAGPDGVPLPDSNPVWQNLWRALKAGGDPHVNVVLLSYRDSRFQLGLKVKRDPAYAIKPLLAAVETALRERFSFGARDLGQPVLQSEVVAAAHAVPGVVAVDLDFLYRVQAPERVGLGVPAIHRDFLLRGRAPRAGPDVVAVDLDFLSRGPAPARAGPSARLLAARMRVSGGAALPAELLTLCALPFHRLEEMP